MNKNIMRAAGFDKEVEAVENGKCPLCGKKINTKDFEDNLYLREYEISGMCQKCQDKVFKDAAGIG